MILFMPVFALTLLSPQQKDSPVDIPALIKKLRSESIEEREVATRRLKAMGKSALPLLQKAARGKDPEVVSRVRKLIRVIEMDARLTPTLRKLKPGLAERLLDGDEYTYTQAFLEAVESKDGK